MARTAISARLSNRRGFTMVEMLMATMVAGWVALQMAHTMKIPFQIQQALGAAERQSVVVRSTELIISDLKEADPASIDWSVIPPAAANYSSISFYTTAYDLANPGAPITTTIQYSFHLMTGSPRGRLERRINGGPASILISDLDPPTAQNPLFQKDGNGFNTLAITLLYHPEGQPLVRIVRRVTLRG